jgi:creatinine amidohydrolase/Fe(II)-dependent formamide hydrolase-like protein
MKDKSTLWKDFTRIIDLRQSTLIQLLEKLNNSFGEIGKKSNHLMEGIFI